MDKEAADDGSRAARRRRALVVAITEDRGEKRILENVMGYHLGNEIARIKRGWWSGYGDGGRNREAGGDHVEPRVRARVESSLYNYCSDESFQKSVACQLLRLKNGTHMKKICLSCVELEY